VERQVNEPVFNEVLGIANENISQVTVKYMEKNLDTTKPGYSEHIVPVPWPFMRSRLHSISYFLVLLLFVIYAFPFKFSFEFKKC